MKLDNKHIHDQCQLVGEEDLDEAIKIGIKMVEFAKREKYLSITANQVGYNKQIMVAMDDDGYDAYLNPEIEPIEISDGFMSVSPQATTHPANIVSFPKKKTLIEVYDKVQVNVYSVANEDRINFEAEGNMALLWQISMAIMNGIDPESIVSCDYMTIKGNKKKKPNAKCPGCGKKNKKCMCASEETQETQYVEFTTTGGSQEVLDLTKLPV